MLEELTDDQIKQLIVEHWREIVGLGKEIERRRHTVPDTNETALGAGHRDGRASG